MTDDSGWWRSGPTRPVPVEGGIKARSSRGAIGQRWWSARFIEVLESLGVGGRLGRGRSYARAGQVVDMDVAIGSVTATVQGSRPQPYRVRIGIATYGKSEWAQVEQAMADSAWYAAKLLSGEMPQDIEEVFGSVGLTLFPATSGDLSLDCNCPDHVVPCKHLAAVCYLLAESFDDDPFGILAVRGRDRETLLANIRARREPVPVSEVVPDADGERDRSLAESLDHFYDSAGALPVLPAVASATDAILAELPEPGVTVRGRTIVELLRPAYRALGRPED